MNKSLVLCSILLLAQVYVTQAGGGNSFRFDTPRSSAYLNAGNCYLMPGVSTSGSSSSYSSSSSSSSRSGSSGSAGSAGQGVNFQYYQLPYGWKQMNNYLYIPNLLSQKGDWTFGLKASQAGGSSAINELFRVNIDGLQVKIAPMTQNSYYNLVIGPQLRSQGVSDSDYNNFLRFVTSQNVNSGSYPSSSSSGVSAGSSYPSGVSPSTSFPSGSYPAGVYAGASYPSGVSGASSGNRDDLSYNGIIDNLISNTRYGPERNQRNIQFQLNTPSSVSLSGGVSGDQRKAALDRQFAANQALLNLNNLITQLTSNVQSSTSSVSSIQNQLSGYRSSSSQCNDKILELNNAKLTSQTRAKDIQDSIDASRQKLAELNPSLNALVSRRDQLTTQRASIERSKPSADTITQLEAEYSSCNARVESDKNSYSTVQNSIQVNNDKIAKLRNDVADAPNQISLINNQLSVIDQTIADLQAKLNDANNQKAKLTSDRDNYNNIVSNSNYQIASIQRDISSATNQLPALQSSIDSRVVQCSNIKTQSDDIRNRIANSQGDYNQLNQQIDVQDGLIASKRGEISRYTDQINSYASTLGSAQNGVRTAQDSLSRQYFICNQFTTTVTNAENDLRAANLKLDTENKFLTDARAKLPAAQAEKTAADDAVNRLLSLPNNSGSVVSTGPTITSSVTITTGPSSTSYPVYPSGTTGGISGVISGPGVVVSGPSGSGVVNGPSGSASGVVTAPYLLSPNYRVGPTSIGSINNYLDKIYGSAVRTQYRPSSRYSDEENMYPLSEVTLNALLGSSSAGIFLPNGISSFLSGISSNQIGSSSLSSSVIGNFGCSSTGNGLISGYGKITSVQPGYITVRGNNNDSYNLRIGGCSRLQASKPAFVASVFDPVFFRGYRGSNNQVQLYDLTCVQ